MNRIDGKLVVITGATAGIGEACARAFAAHGAELILLARREERLAHLKRELEAEHGVRIRTAVLDVRDRDGVIAFGRRLESEGIAPDVLVNNAGLGRGLDPLHEGRLEDWDEMIDTNVKGLLHVTRAILPIMVRRDRGHVVNLGSTAGHLVYPGGNVYNATKFAVRALNDALNVDLAGTRIRVSSIDPGAVETDFSRVRFRGDEERASAVYRGFRPLTAEDVADAVIYVVNAPEHVNVQRMLILPTAQRNAYVLHREG
ncbi:MAG: SDR family NAD(P)-dependent oxidoreductase [Gammaproteobacteria bacterium]|nr:SDR family NAD(P)-dependent oxidoreductase [Gammaproteobacteria bacterium]